MSGEAFGTHSRFHPGRAVESIRDDEQTIQLTITDLPGSSTVTVDQMSRMTGLTSGQVRETLHRLARRGIIEPVTA